MVQPVMPFYVLPLSSPLPSCFQRLHRVHRNAPGGGFDGGVHIDEIGVPRGVPNEHMAWNQIAAGFESFLFW